MKIIGSLLVILSSIISAYYYEVKQREKLTSMKETDRLILFIKNQIEYFSSPLNDIFNKFETKDRQASIIKEKGNVYVFDDSVNREINSLFIGLGKGNKEEEIKSLELMIPVALALAHT